MKRLLIATTNPGKLAEYRRHLAALPVELVSLKDLGLGAVDETGDTFEENALLKARSYFNQSALPTIADDGGFEIDALGGLPGVRSHRWVTGNDDVSDEEIIAHTLERMKDVPEGKRTARLRTVVAFIDGQGGEHVVDAATEGVVPHTAGAFSPGLQYRAILYLPQFGKLFEELSPDEHAQVNQRVLALRKLMPALMEAFGA